MACTEGPEEEALGRKWQSPSTQHFEETKHRGSVWVHIQDLQDITLRRGEETATPYTVLCCLQGTRTSVV